MACARDGGGVLHTVYSLSFLSNGSSIIKLRVGSFVESSCAKCAAAAGTCRCALYSEIGSTSVAAVRQSSIECAKTISGATTRLSETLRRPPKAKAVALERATGRLAAKPVDEDPCHSRGSEEDDSHDDDPEARRHVPGHPFPVLLVARVAGRRPGAAGGEQEPGLHEPVHAAQPGRPEPAGRGGHFVRKGAVEVVVRGQEHRQHVGPADEPVPAARSLARPRHAELRKPCGQPQHGAEVVREHNARILVVLQNDGLGDQNTLCDQDALGSVGAAVDALAAIPRGPEGLLGRTCPAQGLLLRLQTVGQQACADREQGDPQQHIHCQADEAHTHGARH
eukprot:scaffold4111_cov132-Isochrysis_galbana.AAC.2